MKKIFSLIVLLIFISNQAQDSVHIKTKVAAAIQDIKGFVALPNDATNAIDMAENISWLESAFQKRGFNTAILETSNIPLFFASLPMDDNKPTLLFYMHFDGQPVDASKWDQENPYKVVLKTKTEDGFESIPWDSLNNEIDYNWRLYGRATSDDKGPIVMFLHALDMVRELKKEIPYNLKVILDGEEEKGSQPLPDAVNQYKELLLADQLIIADGPVHNSGLPTIVYGCRGITTLSLTTYGPIKPQHSGHFGNYAPNPAMQLSQLLASMKDSQGRVTIGGFYDGINITEDIRTVLASVPDDEETIKKNLQIASTDKVGGNYQESLQYPSLNIRGLKSGWVGSEARTIVPESATAEIDIRLVPESDGNRLKNLIKNHAIKMGYHLVNDIPDEAERLKYDKILRVQEREVTHAFRTPMNSVFGHTLLSTFEQVFQLEVVQIRIMGGTVPIAPFINALNVPAYIIPLVNQDNNQHSPNENLKIGQIAYGIQALGAIMTMKPED